MSTARAVTSIDDAFTSIRLGPLTLRNRFIKAATNEGMARDGLPTKALVEHHRTMAAGGAAMSTVAYCAVSADGRTFVDQLQLTKAVVPHLRVLTDAVHHEGAAACAQITHGGAFNFLPQLSTRYPRSASGGFNAPGMLVGRLFKKAMTTDDLERITDEFVQGARRARECGFDVVEIHMGHGYLLSQFLSPKYNHRRDEFGGDAEHRAGFPAMVLRRVLDAVGTEMAVTCKLSVTEAFKGGGTAEDAVVIAGVLEREGAHLLVLSGGMNVESPWAIFGSPLPKTAAGPVPGWVGAASAKLLQLTAPKMQFRELYLRPHSLKVRAAVQMPLAYLGGAKSVAGIRQVLDDGFDYVVMGRALIHDPALVGKFRDGSVTESGCTACNECVALMYSPGGTGCVLRGANDIELNRLPGTL